MKLRSAKKIGGLLAATLLVAECPSAFAGATTDLARKTVVEQKPESNPLWFFDGKLCFDIEERLRLEVRENNFDFNSSLNSLTDDTWLLQRFRLGVAIKPAGWLKIYAQGQDSREIDAKR